MIKRHTGPILFLILVCVIVTCSLLAFMETGAMGIEERFGQATGIHSSSEYNGEKAEGFFLEGDAFLYIVFLAGLGTACAVIYRFRAP